MSRVSSGLPTGLLPSPFASSAPGSAVSENRHHVRVHRSPLPAPGRSSGRLFPPRLLLTPRASRRPCEVPGCRAACGVALPPPSVPAVVVTRTSPSPRLARFGSSLPSRSSRPRPRLRESFFYPEPGSRWKPRILHLHKNRVPRSPPCSLTRGPLSAACGQNLPTLPPAGRGSALHSAPRRGWAGGEPLTRACVCACERASVHAHARAVCVRHGVGKDPPSWSLGSTRRSRRTV